MFFFDARTSDCKYVGISHAFPLYRDDNPLASAYFPPKGEEFVVAQDSLSPEKIDNTPLYRDAFKDLNSWAVVPILAAEQGRDKMPIEGIDNPNDYSFLHRDPGIDRINKGYCSTPWWRNTSLSPHEICRRSNSAAFYEGIKLFNDAGYSDPGVLALINYVDLKNQSPEAATAYLYHFGRLVQNRAASEDHVRLFQGIKKYVLKHFPNATEDDRDLLNIKIGEDLSVEQIALLARVLSFKIGSTGAGPYSATGLEDICMKSPLAYGYISEDLGHPKLSQIWLEHCIFHDQWRRVKDIVYALKMRLGENFNYGMFEQSKDLGKQSKEEIGPLTVSLPGGGATVGMILLALACCSVAIRRLWDRFSDRDRDRDEIDLEEALKKIKKRR
jgi:hypothetical protein